MAKARIMRGGNIQPKCMPGMICIETVSILLIVFIALVVGYLVYTNQRKDTTSQQHTSEKRILVAPMGLQSVATRHTDVFNDPYAPPLKEDGYYYRTDSGDIRGHPPIHVPVNIETRGLNTQYSQMGILTNNSDKILPLMGRRHMSGRDKYQYYTISNTGNLNTKLPISVNGRSCTSEYGCDQIMQGDKVYVEGYKETFDATIYETNNFHYLPL